MTCVSGAGCGDAAAWIAAGVLVCTAFGMIVGMLIALRLRLHVTREAN